MQPRYSEEVLEDLHSPVRRALDQLGGPVDVLIRHGIEFQGHMALCPFHYDREPSLSVFTGADGKERYRCHGCGVRGDALDLEAALSGLSLREAIRRWAA
jgi:DNA primase